MTERTLPSNERTHHYRLIQLAAELARGSCIPDWSDEACFCKTTPARDRAKVRQALRLIDDRLKDYAVALRGIADEVSKTMISEDRAHTSTIEERDRVEAYADQLAEMIGVFCEVDVGEHSSANCPWEEAIEVMRIAIGNKQTASETGVSTDLLEVATVVSTMDCFYSGSTHKPDCECIVGKAERALARATALKASVQCHLHPDLVCPDQCQGGRKCVREPLNGPEQQT